MAYKQRLHQRQPKSDLQWIPSLLSLSLRAS